MDKTEKLSFLDSNTVYPESYVPEAIVDLEVRNGQLISTKANDVEVDIGAWHGRSGVQIKTMTIDSASKIVTTLSNDVQHITPVVKSDDSIPAVIKGTGLLTPPITFPHLFNDIPTDYYEEENDRLFMFATAPKFTSLTATSMVTVTGVTVTASSLYNLAYQLYRIFNRKIDSVTDGLLGKYANNLTVTFVFPVDKPAEIKGYIYRNLRDDLTTRGYVIEYQRENSPTWITVDTRPSIGMEVIEYYFTVPIVAKAIRWRSTSYAGTPGIGRLDWIVGRSGNTINASPISFPHTHFSKTEDDDKVYLEPNRLTPIENTDVEFDIFNHHHFMCVPTNGDRVPFNPAGINVVPWNVVKTDASVAGAALPAIKLKPGRWYYQYAVSLVNAGKFRVYLAYRGLRYPLSDLMTGITQLTASRSVVVHDEGVLEIHETAEIYLVVEQSGNGGLSKVANGNYSASLELWWLESALTPITAPILPSAGLVPAPYKHLEGLFPAGVGDAGSNLFTASLANITWWANATNYLVMGVYTHFRIWRCTIAGGSTLNATLKITKMDGGAYPLGGAHKSLTKVGSNEWEVMTYTLPPGIYRFDYIAERKDSAWFIEKMVKPDTWEFGEVTTRVTLPMTSGSEAGQTVTSSSIFSTSYNAFNAFTAIPLGDGWSSGATSEFGERIDRVNLPMTATPQNGQTATWSAAFSEEHTGVQALGTTPSANGWAVPSAPTVEAPHWLKLEFANPVTFDAYSITNRDYWLPINPRDWTVQISDNGVDWTTVSTVVDDMRNGRAEIRLFVLTEPVTAKFVRLSITKHHVWADAPDLAAVGQFLIGSVATKSEWLNVLFDTPQRFTKYQLTNRNYADTNASHAPKSWELLGRTAGGPWQTLHTVVNDTRNTYGLTREFTLAEPAICDEVRLNITAKNDGTGGEAAYKYVCVQHFQLSNVENKLNTDWL